MDANISQNTLDMSTPNSTVQFLPFRQASSVFWPCRHTRSLLHIHQRPSSASVTGYATSARSRTLRAYLLSIAPSGLAMHTPFVPRQSKALHHLGHIQQSMQAPQALAVPSLQRASYTAGTRPVLWTLWQQAGPAAQALSHQSKQPTVTCSSAEECSLLH